MEPPLSYRQRLPQDIFYDIVVDFFGEYLYQVIIEDDKPSWNPFVVIPSVSKAFYAMSQPLFRRIFGESREGPIDYIKRKEQFTRSKALWAKTRMTPPPLWDPQAEGFNPEDIPRWNDEVEDPNILTIYDYMSLGLYYYRTSAFHIEDTEPICFLRLWTPYMSHAMRICDSMQDNQFLRVAARHVADVTTQTMIDDCLGTISQAIKSMLKPSEDVITRSTNIPDNMDMNLTSLQNLEMNKRTFQWGLEGGYVNRTCPTSMIPSREVIIKSKIVEALALVIEYDWLDDDEFSLKKRAEELHATYSARIKSS